MAKLLRLAAAVAILLAPAAQLETRAAGSTLASDPVAAALALEAKGDVASALSLLQRDATGSPETRSDLLLAAARMLARHGRLADALAEGYAGIAADPSDGFSYLEVSKILDLAGRPAAAIELAQEAASRDVRVLFAAKDLVFEIQTHSALAGDEAQNSRTARVPVGVWVLSALSILLFVAGLAMVGFWQPWRRSSRSGSAESVDFSDRSSEAAERMVPQFAAMDSPAAFGRALGPGDKVGPYEILRVVASSFHSTLYCAADPRLGRQVALKQVNALGTHAEAALGRFQKEVQSLITLSTFHDGV
ncbi:MAG: hypothetical protein KGR26_10955, partial [Cyanobacteria bacterium REEB65]|nr:hypothetical protein [Cyanobacteria bacterium REEB65]